MAERIIEDPVLRQRYSFTRTSDEQGEVLRIETWVDHGGGVTPHIHPGMEERFEVLGGNPSFLAGRKWSEASAGDVVVVPAGTRHAYRNDGDELAHIVCHARPPSTLQEFLEDATILSRSGKMTRSALPKSPSALLQAALMARHYRDMIVLLFPPAPPQFVQRLLFPPLARLAERRGHKVGGFAREGEAGT
jgi:quercetin dioxygenase-like cupin family protein